MEAYAKDLGNGQYPRDRVRRTRIVKQAGPVDLA